MVVGCGDPGLIDMYAGETGCQFPIFTDPTRQLYRDLGMIRNLAIGTRPAYQRRSMARSIFESLMQGLRQVPTGLATKSGDTKQIGGEFLFEPPDVLTPVTSPTSEGGAALVEREGPVGEEKKVTWCHRMKTTRDHSEVPELMEVLGLDG